MPRGGKREGSGRKATGKMAVTKSLTLHIKEWDALKTEADRQKITPTKLAADIIRKTLDIKVDE